MRVLRSALLLAVVFTLWASWVSGEQLESPMFIYLEKAGVRELMEQQRIASQRASREQLDRVADQMIAQLPELPDEYTDELRAMVEELSASVENAYTTEEVLRVYAEPFDRNYPGDALEPAIASLSTDDGQLLVRTLAEGANAAYSFRAQRQQAAMESATQEFLARFQQLLQRIQQERGSSR